MSATIVNATLANRFDATPLDIVAGGSEVVAFDAGRFYVTNGATGAVDVFTAAAGLVTSLDLTGLPNYGGVASVAAMGGVVAAAYANADATEPGRVALFTRSLAGTHTLIGTVEVGAVPDMIRFSPDGTKLFVAIEGEQTDTTSADDPPGGVAVVTLAADIDDVTVQFYGFGALDAQADALRAAGVRLFPGKLPSTDFEPEYIAVDPTNSDNLLVTLQEANAVGVLNLVSGQWNIVPLGTVDHSLPGQGIDASDRDSAINIANWPVHGLRMPDAIAAFQTGGQTYVITANEGDARDTDEVRLGNNAYQLDPTTFPNAAALKQNAALGRLTVSRIDGDTDNDGDYDAIYSYGSRSFTIFNAAGTPVFESGDDFERKIAELFPGTATTDRFNANSEDDADDLADGLTPASFDTRSDNKGPEPEAVAVAEIEGRTLAFIGLERDAGIMVYDVTVPAQARFMTYIDSRAAGDFGPEVITVIPGSASATGKTQIAVSYEHSGTTAVYDITVLNVVINEILVSTTGTDVEYIELYGTPGGSLAGLSLIGIESDAGGTGAAAPGTIDFRFDFAADATLGENGFFLVGNALTGTVYGMTPDALIADNSLENSSATYVLVQTASLSGGRGTLIAGTEKVIDGLVLSDSASEAGFFSQPVIGPDGTFLPAGARRETDGVDTDTAADWVIADFNLGSANTPTAATRPPVEPVATRIHTIQGSGAASSVAGQVVTVEAIVVGDFQAGDADQKRNLGGFYLQEEDGDADGDAATSEGIFVFVSSAGLAGFADVNVGDRVRVTGTVAENFGMTQIGSVSAVTVVSSGNVLPTAALIDLPAATTTTSQNGFAQPDLEAFEGMLVEFADTLTVTEMFNLDRFNEIRLVAGERPQQFTQTNTPDAAGYQAHLLEIGARTITYDDGLNVQNAAIENLDGFQGFTTATAPRMGDTVSGLTGVLDYQWAGTSASGATWRVRSTEDGSVEFDRPETAERPAAPEDVGGRLKVASFNVLNYFTTIDLPGVTTALGFDPRGADTAAEFSRQTEKLVTTILAMGADVLGLVELENDFRAGASGNAIEYLVGQLNAKVGAGLWNWVDPGDFVGSDAISAGFIYRTDKVMTKGAAAVLADASFTDPLNLGQQQSRPAVAQTFVEKLTGASFTAVANHFKSKGSGVNDAADDDGVAVGAGFYNETRTKAAVALADWLETDPTGSGDGDFILMGDFNAYAMEDPIKALEAAGYTDLGAAFEGEGNYSYVFDGQTGTLDYAFANRSLFGQVTGATEWRINSDEADALDYNLDFGRSAAYFDGSVPFRSSDHDPIIVGLDLLVDIVGTARNDRLQGTAFGDRILSGAGRNDVMTGGGGEDIFVFGAETRNGRRETDQIRDYNPLEDVIDLGGATVVSFRETRKSVQLTLDGDGDSIVVSGVSKFDQIVFLDDLIA